MPLRVDVKTNTRFVPSQGTTHPAANVSRGYGRRSVVYRATTGKTFEAIVIGPGSAGSANSLRLMIPALRMKGTSVYLKDNIEPATTVKSTNAYFDRWAYQTPAT